MHVICLFEISIFKKVLFFTVHTEHLIYAKITPAAWTQSSSWYY